MQAAVTGPQHLHGDLTYRFDNPPFTYVTVGWPDGIRLAIDNLLENAARHGAPIGHIDVTVTGGSTDRIVITVADDGRGLPAAERLNVVGRNGSQAGSGLGLALVEQQARLHRRLLRARLERHRTRRRGGAPAAPLLKPPTCSARSRRNRGISQRLVDEADPPRACRVRSAHFDAW